MNSFTAANILGVKSSATKEEVKAAYRQAVKECHPDRHLNSPKGVQLEAAENFKKVKEAYETLLTGGNNDAHFQRRHTGYQRAAGGRQHFYRQADWSYTRKAYTYRPNPKEYGGFTSWFYSSGRTRTAEAIRQQATLVVFALGGLVLLDAAANSLWNISNEGRLYKNIEREAGSRLDQKRKQQAAVDSEKVKDPVRETASTPGGGSTEGQGVTAPSTDSTSAEVDKPIR